MKENRVVVVTGAGRGIATAVARRFAGERARVVIVDLSPERAAQVAQELNQEGNGEALAVTCDVTSSDSVALMIDEVHRKFGPVDVLVNAAGAYYKYRPTHETTELEWDAVVDSNLKGIFLCAKAVLPDMMDMHGGRIINFASNAARSVATALGVEYTAAKAGVLGITRHMAKEYGKYNILINTIAPGPTNVPRVKESISAEFFAEIPSTIPLGRYAEADEIATVVQFLASDGASFMTGATVDVNGGIIMV